MARLKRSSLKNKRAFSLVEVMIAVAILSIGIAAVLQAFSFCAKSTGISMDVTRAVFLSQDILQELEYQSSEGKLNDSDQGVVYKFNWEYQNILDPALKLYTLNFKIGWERNKRKESLEISSYFLK